MEQEIIMAEEALAEFKDNLKFAELHFSQSKARLDESLSALIRSAVEFGRVHQQYEKPLLHLPKKYYAQFVDTHFAELTEKYGQRLDELKAELGEYRRRAEEVGTAKERVAAAMARLEYAKRFVE